jgi:hypothetical protein
MKISMIVSGLFLSVGFTLVPGLAAAQAQAAASRPDLSGTWDNGSGLDFVKPQRDGNSICVMACPPAPAAAAAGAEPAAGAAGPPPAPAPQPPTRPQYRPEFAAKVADLTKRQDEEDPVLRCVAPGLPRIGPPDKIVHSEREVIFLYEDYTGDYFRIVPTDGRGHRDDVEPSFLGDAVGRWEGDTLVVETVNFNDLTWLTDDGAFHTRDLRVVERLRRSGDTLEWIATAYDPAVLAQPWELRARMAQLTDNEIVEAPPCMDQDIDHIVDGSHHPNPR